RIAMLLKELLRPTHDYCLAVCLASGTAGFNWARSDETSGRTPNIFIHRSAAESLRDSALSSPTPECGELALLAKLRALGSSRWSAEAIRLDERLSVNAALGVTTSW